MKHTTRLTHLLLLICFSHCSFSFAQSMCGFNETLAKKNYEHSPRPSQSPNAESQLQNVVTIPVVVHVVWHDPSENISDAQIFSQIDVLNEDFRKLNPDTGLVRPIFASLAGDAGVEFCLAQRDPQGNATNGITRTYSSVTDWGCDDSMKYAAYGGADGWPGADYLNIWVCKLNCANGYAYYPGTPDPIDGVVIHYYVFGRIGNVAPGYQGRTCDHEVGHYFGLYHTFDYTGLCEGNDTSNCSSEGDYVCDTPADNNPDFGCPAFVNDCADTPVDNPDQTENYMDYGDDGCRVMFTKGQIERMRGYIFADRISLLTSLGCVPPAGNYFDVGVLSLEFPADEICVGNIIPVIRISNTSTAALTSLIVDYQLDANGLNTFTWTGNIGAGSADTVTLPPIMVTAGSHLMHISLSNPNGQTDQNLSNNSGDFPITAITSGLPIPFAEEFEYGNFPYPHWSVEDPDNTYGWEHNTLAGSFGSQASMRTRNFYNQHRNTSDGLLLPKFDLTGITAAAINFDVAYSDPNSTYYSDSLRLSYSLDCGATWNSFWQDGGLSLATAPPPSVFSEFVPDSSQWATHFILLNQFLGTPLLALKFESINGWGNDLYIDRINLSITTAISDANATDVRIFPNPANEKLTLLIPRADLIDYALFNSLGENVIACSSWNTVHSASIEINTGMLPTGIYFLSITSADMKYHTFKFSIQH